MSYVPSVKKHRRLFTREKKSSDNRLYSKYEKQYEKMNGVNILTSRDINTFPTCKTDKELIKNLKILIDSDVLTNNPINVIKYFDYIILHIDIVLSGKMGKNKKFMNKINKKLIEFSKNSKFGPRRSRYYHRILFPDGKCEHNITDKFRQHKKCVYKHIENSKYCRTHTEFIENNVKKIVKKIEKIIPLPTEVIRIIAMYN